MDAGQGFMHKVIHEYCFIRFHVKRHFARMPRICSQKEGSNEKYPENLDQQNKLGFIAFRVLLPQIRLEMPSPPFQALINFKIFFVVL